MGQAGLYVISAPSGTGKTTIVRQLLATIPDLVHSISYTTRRSRPGEGNGVDYYFVDVATFDRMCTAGDFVEWAKVHGARYGTPKAPLERWLAQGQDIILDLDIQGGRALRAAFPETVTIFLMPPSREALAERLKGRGTDDPATVARRLKEADNEIAAKDEYHHVVLNDSVAQAARAVARIILTRRGGTEP